MRFDVEISAKAGDQYDKILFYIAYELKNSQALESVMNDFDLSIKKLSENAEMYDFCRSERLRKMGLRKLGFESHRYLFIYRIAESNHVIIEGIYHELQDYEHAL